MLKRTRQKMGAPTARSVGKDEDRAQRVDAACDRIAAWIFDSARSEPHSKGAYATRAWMFRRDHILGVLDAIGDDIKDCLGQDELPSVATIERWLSERYGKADAALAAAEHYQETIGFRAQWAGQVVLLDATGLPVRVHGINQTKDKNGKKAHWLHLAVDLASNHTWTHWNPGRSEYEGWSDALLSILRRLDFAPEWAIIDRIGGVFEALRYLRPGEATDLSAGVLAWFAAGVRPYIHASARPTAGAQVERGARGFKQEAARRSLTKRVRESLAGRRNAKGREFANEAAFAEFVSTAEAALNNAKPLQRGNNQRTRAALWAHDESARRRDARRLATDWQARLPEILGAHKVVSVNSGELTFRQDGRRISARIGTAVPLRARDSVALVMPSGLLAADHDPDTMRAIIVEPAPQGGMPRYHAVTAQGRREDWFGQYIDQPIVGSHPVAKPQTVADAEGERRLAAARVARMARAIAGGQMDPEAEVTPAYTDADAELLERLTGSSGGA
jgi:hypothetical protein